MSFFRVFRRWLFTGIPSYAGWLLANIVLALFFPFFLLMEAVQRSDLSRKICVGFIYFFFLKYLPFVGMYRIEKTEDVAKLKKCEKCLLVVNHTSWLDALILLSLVPNVQILVSRRYGRVPLVSRAMRLLGCIFVDRRSRESAAEAVAELRAMLETGRTVAVFPEGTRAPRGELKPFQDVFFALAIESSTKVVPAILYLDTPFLGPRAENFLTRRCAILKIRVLDPVLPDPKEKGQDLSFCIRRRMKQAIAELDGPKE